MFICCPASCRVRLGKKKYDYRLPLGSVLAPRYDPDTGEQFPGNYFFNPYTGTKLVLSKPEPSAETEKE